jgi:hypothetical protein
MCATTDTTLCAIEKLRKEHTNANENYKGDLCNQLVGKIQSWSKLRRLAERKIYGILARPTAEPFSYDLCDHKMDEDGTK